MQVSRVLWLRVSHKAAIEGRSRAGVISRLHWGEICSQAHAPGCWQPSVLTGFGQRYQCLATWPCLKVPYNMTACFFQRKGCKQGWTRWKPVFCNLISELTLLFLPCSVLEDSCHWIKPIFKGKGLDRGMNTRKQRSLGIILVKVLGGKRHVNIAISFKGRIPPANLWLP